MWVRVGVGVGVGLHACVCECTCYYSYVLLQCSCRPTTYIFHSCYFYLCVVNISYTIYICTDIQVQPTQDLPARMKVRTKRTIQ